MSSFLDALQGMLTPLAELSNCEKHDLPSGKSVFISKDEKDRFIFIPVEGNFVKREHADIFRISGLICPETKTAGGGCPPKESIVAKKSVYEWWKEGKLKCSDAIKHYFSAYEQASDSFKGLIHDESEGWFGNHVTLDAAISAVDGF